MSTLNITVNASSAASAASAHNNMQPYGVDNCFIVY
jgi:microcystin-dependent protein